MSVDRTDQSPLIVPCEMLLFPDGRARLSCKLDAVWKALGYSDVRVELGEALAGDATELVRSVEPGPGGE